jgi:VanZ family protein
MSPRTVAAAVVVAVVAASLVPLGGGASTFPDGLFHVVGYAAVAAAVVRAGPPTRRTLAVAVVVAVAVGAGVELLQGLVPGRTPSVADAAANLVGAVAGVTLAVVARRSGRR